MENLINAGKLEEKFPLLVNPMITLEEFTPLDSRISQKKPELLLGLNKLKINIGQENFDKYINIVQNINTNGKSLLIISGSERLRSIIEREFITALQEAFEVEHVQIVGGAGFAGTDAF